jgi:hypothetical protein
LAQCFKYFHLTDIGSAGIFESPLRKSAGPVCLWFIEILILEFSIHLFEKEIETVPVGLKMNTEL